MAPPLDPSHRFYRYSRQVLLPVVGEAGQERLAAARVGLVGCGALGSVIAGHLVRAGVGFLRLADADRAEIHNLQRQMLYTEEDVWRGVPKAQAAATSLQAVNSEVEIEPLVTRIDARSLPRFAEGLDLIVDGTDNFPTRFLLNDYCLRTGLSWVYGGVIGTSGMSLTIVPGEGPCLRCLVPELPGPGQAPTADVAGVLGTIVSVIGSVEATEALKLIVAPESRNRGLFVFDVWDLASEHVELRPDPDCPACGRGAHE